MPIVVTWLIHFVVAFASTVGFGVITNVPRRTLLPAGFTGALAWLVYVLVSSQTASPIAPNLLAAIVIGLLANLFAIVVRAPVNLLYIPCLVSLVPGALIYMSMKDFTLGRDNAAQQGLVKTLTIAIALAVGFVIAEAIFNPLRPTLTRWVRRHAKE
ncbi:threonine/serine exporter family protein [Lacticaseibacillus nasuensis]|uniref:Threonine/Serine exporter ThrE domain-containing protein n=1 Tax=Lacticaseibacillus nasuensis JCM 17158 TaxID=1291734 RepID=A0A0R1JXK8_9LACO|nr:threonine/serine exporter family protein [Lacticaseibacillus nasuensis]KRK72482.1 hypothetical protein FD02_GL001454 [Lacticaseibacillus nasuensis JCM 17158]